MEESNIFLRSFQWLFPTAGKTVLILDIIDQWSINVQPNELDKKALGMYDCGSSPSLCFSRRFATLARWLETESKHHTIPTHSTRPCGPCAKMHLCLCKRMIGSDDEQVSKRVAHIFACTSSSAPKADGNFFRKWVDVLLTAALIDSRRRRGRRYSRWKLFYRVNAISHTLSVLPRNRAEQSFCHCQSQKSLAPYTHCDISCPIYCARPVLTVGFGVLITTKQTICCSQ